MTRALPTCAAACVLAFAAPSEPAEPISYSLSFPDAQHHYVDVEASFPTSGESSIELMMAVWTPGSYLVREYARHVENLAARAEGTELPVEKTAKTSVL